MAGSIGMELAKQLCSKNKVFGIDQNETGLFGLTEELKSRYWWVNSRIGDIRDKETIRDVFSDFKPQIVFHTAALKHVTPNESYPNEAIQTNIIGTQNLIHESKKWECLEKFIFISTDKVVNAESIMGITKRCAEGLVKRAGKQFASVRFGNVMASNGSVLEIWERQFKEGNPLTLTHPDMERYMMTIPQACLLIQEAAQKGKDGETWVMDMGERIKMGGLCRMFLVTKGKPDYPIKTIGLRRGETMKEYLMTEEEKVSAIKINNFWILK
jgi:FlaA1/EpsC-like NDP-sugar epimerase